MAKMYEWHPTGDKSLYQILKDKAEQKMGEGEENYRRDGDFIDVYDVEDIAFDLFDNYGRGLSEELKE